MEIPLTQGKMALIDDDDLSLISPYKWHAHAGSYRSSGGSLTKRWTAVATLYIPSEGCRPLYMHHLIFGRSPVDHINRDSLDNRRENLRDGPPWLQAVNKGTYKGKRFKGVTWHQRIGKWQARIRVHGKLYHLGYFENPVDAARVYNEAAVDAWGSLAVLNVA